MAKKTKAVRVVLGNFEKEMKEAMVKNWTDEKKSYADCIRFTENEIIKSKKMHTFRHKVHCFRNDGVFQLNQAIEELYGVTSGIEEGGGPSGGTDTVETIDVILADGRRKKVPYGKIALDGLGEDSYIDINYDSSTHYLHVKGQCQYQYVTLIDGIMDRTKDLISNSSIYKGHALEITEVSIPTILDLSNIDNEFLVLSDDAEARLRPLRARITHPEVCKSQGVPLKFGCLLSGTYGTGKTLLAFKLAKEAVDNGWIFIYLKNPKLLAETIKLCKNIDQSGHGAVIFVEDIDQVLRGERDTAMQDILNTLDGGDTKGMNVITLFTTNHLEVIEPTFLRGKRIGSIINLGYMDAKMTEQFITQTIGSRDLKLVGDFTEVYSHIENSNITPAFMAEIMDSVKSDLIYLKTNEITPDILAAQVNSYVDQVKLTATKKLDKPLDERLGSILKEILESETTAAGARMLSAETGRDLENYKK